MVNWIAAYGAPIFLWVLGISLILMLSGYLPIFFGAMWIPTSRGVIKQMLELAQLQPGQRLVDLGAGDGRVVIMAARMFKAEAIGVEIDPLRWLLANFLIVLWGVRRRAKIHYANVFDFDLTGADVVFIYLTRPANQRLKSRLAQQLPPGTKVVSRFAIPGWNALVINDSAMIFLYEIGNTGPDVKTRLI